jgi:hypothetical protein
MPLQALVASELGVAIRPWAAATAAKANERAMSFLRMPRSSSSSGHQQPQSDTQAETSVGHAARQVSQVLKQDSSEQVA